MNTSLVLCQSYRLPSTVKDILFDSCSTVIKKWFQLPAKIYDTMNYTVNPYQKFFEKHLKIIGIADLLVWAQVERLV